jgi:hypothetical protein
MQVNLVQLEQLRLLRGPMRGKAGQLPADAHALSIEAAYLTNAGGYSVVVTNLYGSVNRSNTKHHGLHHERPATVLPAAFKIAVSYCISIC